MCGPGGQRADNSRQGMDVRFSQDGVRHDIQNVYRGRLDMRRDNQDLRDGQATIRRDIQKLQSGPAE